MNSYEVAIIVRPDVEEDAQKELIEQLSQLLTAQGGQVDEVEEWGRRRLAYPINKVNEGYYYFVKGQFSPSALPDLERVAKLSEDVLRHMVIRQDK
jgi:small subunit ribosomal protein S6